MIDKIDNTLQFATGRTAGADNRSNDKSAAAGGNASNASQVEQLSLTDQASRLQSLEQKLASMPMMDPGRVATAQAAIADGSYTIDPMAVANKLIDLESALYGNG